MTSSEEDFKDSRQEGMQVQVKERVGGSRFRSGRTDLADQVCRWVGLKMEILKVFLLLTYFFLIVLTYFYLRAELLLVTEYFTSVTLVHLVQ